jgi:hypothetical protein
LQVSVSKAGMHAISLCLLTLLAVARPLPAPAQAPAGPVGAFGAALNGLQLRIIPVTSGSGLPADVKLDVVLENVGGSDFVLNLGTMLANGKVMWPYAIRLMLTDASGQRRELRFASRTAGVAGRIDDYIIALRAASTYTVRVSLKEYMRDDAAKLANGRYKIAAQFLGRRASGVNVDMQGVALLNFWSGTAHSNVAEFEVSR